MKIYKPLWEEGTLITPQHFQQQDLHTSLVYSRLLSLLGEFSWGVLDVALAQEQLRSDKLQIEMIQMFFNDGTYVDNLYTDIQIPARNLSDVGGEVFSTVVSLVLPLWKNHSNNVMEKNITALTNKRIQREFVAVEDLFGDDSIEFAIERLNLHLKFDFETDDDCISCPIIKLQRGENGKFIVDSSYIPPNLDLSKIPSLVALLKRINDVLLSRIASLSQRVKERNQKIVDFSVSDSMLFWFLHSINSVFPEISHLEQNPRQHPEVLYKLLIRLHGMLITFCVERDQYKIEPYNHLDIKSTFTVLEQKIMELLDTVIPSPVILLNLERIKKTQWKTHLYDNRLQDGVLFYLSVHIPGDSNDMISQFPLVCKIGSPEEVERILNLAVVGIPIKPLSQIPPSLPVRMDNSYFSLDVNHPSFKRMLESKVCSIYVPGSFANINLSLYAVVDI